MVSAIQLNQTAQVESQGKIGTAAPETGEFDFMSYLLGLQASPTENNELISTAADDKSEKEKPGMQMQGLEALFPSAIPSQLTSMPDAETVTTAEPRELARQSSDSRDLRAETAASSLATDLPVMTGTELGNARQSAAQKDLALERYTLNDVNSRERAYTAIAGQARVDMTTEVSPEIVNSTHFARISDLDDVQPREKGDSVFTVLSAQVDSPFEAMKVDANLQVAEAPASREDALPVNDLFARVETLAQSGGGKMVVTLDPPELGRVSIQVTARGKRVQVEMTSEKDVTKNLLESQFDELKSSIQSQDLTLSKLEVRTERDGSGFSMQQFAHSDSRQSSQSYDREHFQHNRESRFSSPVRRDVEIPAVTSPFARVNSVGARGVDVRI